MGIGWLFLTIGVLWALQLLLSYQQARAFMARARALRRQGRVSIGASPTIPASRRTSPTSC